MKVKDKWFRFIAITLLWGMAVYSNKLFLQPFTWTLVARILLIPVSIFLTWQGNRFIILHFREKFSGQYALAKRIAFVFVTGMLFTWVMLVSTAFATNLMLYGPSTAYAGIENGQLLRTLLSFPLFFTVRTFL